MEMQGGGGPFGSPWHTPPRVLESLGAGTVMGMEACGLLDLQDSTFEPQTRARSNTWPLPRPENYVEPGDGSDSNKCSNQQLAMGTGLPVPTAAQNTKKNSSRRNAWGNLSYADLITQAIQSATDSRLTLSQIYEWMVQNVPYFKDKGDSNSSAGWKNSIRHNLSLHNRFMRVQNEGTGKSSWWMINPDAKPGKSVRRRAASMETSKFEKRRGRVKKKVEAMRVGSGMTTNIQGENHSSPGSSVSEGLDLFPDSPIHSSAGFQLSPDFRQRASSNASSCGRLSPIPSLHGAEPDWTTSGGSGYNPSSDYQQQQQQPALDQLAGNLAESMKLQNVGDYLQGFVNSGNQHIPPPPYQQPYGTSPYGLPQCPLHRIQNCGCMHSCDPRESLSPSSCPGMSPSYPQSEPSPDPMGGAQYLSTGGECSPSQGGGNSSPPTSQTSTLLLRRNGGATLLEQQNQPSTMMGQLMGALNNSALLDDLNINIETIPGGFDCNVDELIKHELSMDGSLDFNFQSQAAAAAAMVAHHQQQQQQNHHQLGANHLQHLHHQHLHHHAGGSVQLGIGGSGMGESGLADGGVNGNGARGVAVSSQPSQYSASVTPPSWVH